jgi:exosortase
MSLLRTETRNAAEVARGPRAGAATVPAGGAAASPPPPPTVPHSLSPWAAGLLIALAAAAVWSYWPVLADMAQKWARDAQYSHGYLVPLFSLYLLWSRRGLLAGAPLRPSWWGLPLLAVGLLLRLAGAFFFFDWLEAVSLLPLLGGAVLLLAGRPALRWSWPAIAFLAFMIPLPYRVETALSHPLQRVATLASTYILQLLGRPAFAEGNVIVINDARIGVVEACNGLGMLLLFFAMATAVAIVSRRRSLIEKAVIVASAAPVAVAANVTRITVTSLLHEFVNSHWADLVFHDLAGWLMMPLALGLLGLELRVLSRLFVEVKVAERSAQPVRPATAPRGSRRRPARVPAP